MSINKCSYEQTPVMQEAVEMVVRLTKDGAIRREEISTIIVRIADRKSLDANSLANLAIAELAETARKAG